MKKILLIILLLVFIFGFYFYFQESKIPERAPSIESLGLGSIIFENTKFKTFNLNYYSFKYPDWQELKIDLMLIWPKEIAEKEEILLYLTNSDGVRVLATKRKIETTLLGKPYPLIFRETFAKDLQILKEQGGVTERQLIREKFFENGILIESRSIIFGTSYTSIQKSIIVNEDSSPFIYSVGVSAKSEVFEDYRPLAEYIISSVRYY